MRIVTNYPTPCIMERSPRVIEASGMLELKTDLGDWFHLLDTQEHQHPKDRQVMPAIPSCAMRTKCPAPACLFSLPNCFATLMHLFSVSHGAC